MATPSNIHVDNTVIQFLCHGDEAMSPNQFLAFSNFYHDIVNTNPAPVNPLISIPHSFLSSPTDIIAIVSKLRAQCNTTKVEILQQLFPQTYIAGAELRLNSMVKIAFMVESASFNFFSDGYQRWGEYRPVQWKDNQSLVNFIESAFPRSVYQVTATQSRLKAWKLKRRYGISIVPTNDLTQHLLYDAQSRVLTVFHQVAWLKAHLRYASNLEDTESTQDFLAKGVLPPTLLRETLFSIYRILFPLDEKSAQFTRRFVTKQEKERGIDRDLLVDPGAIHSNMAEPFGFIYWGKRLERLEKIVTNPPPSSTLTSWFERHTSERNALTVAIIGLLLAVVFGFLSFIVGIVQLVVSYYAWKYPVASVN